MVKRYILFIALSFLAFWLYAVLFPPSPRVKPKAPETATEKAEPPAGEPEKAPPEQPTKEEQATSAPAFQKPKVTEEELNAEEKAVLENSFCRISFTKYGAAISEILLHTTETNKEVVIQGKDPVRIPSSPPNPAVEDLAERVSESLRLNPLVITSRNGEGLDLSAHPFELKEKTETKLVYELSLDSRLKVTKSFELAKDDYLVTLDVSFQNLSEQAIPIDTHQVKVGTVLPLDPKTGYREITFAALGAGRVQGLSAKPAKTVSKLFSFLRWASAGNKYFALILSPQEKDKKIGNATIRVDKVIPEVARTVKPSPQGKNKSSDRNEEYFYSLGIGVQKFDLRPGEKIVHRYCFYAGPKEYDRLRRLSRTLPKDPEFDKVMHLGWFGFIGVPLLKILKISYKVIPNYGLAIIFLTILVKVILYPLDQKSYRSMKEMQKIQPLIAELRKKYKDDPRRAQVEQMKLFKEHKVNPLGGCLPLLLQMPVLFAMFQMIRTAVELRKAPFLLWIKDLSEADGVLDFGVEIPLIGHSLNILPLVLIFAFVLQNKVSKVGTAAAAQDPQQKMMGHFMTVFFGILFYNMPSGLNLYFAVSTILRAVQQYFVQKRG